MPNLFERRDPWGNSPAMWIVAFMVFLLPFGWWSLKQIRLENDVEHWLPADHPQLKVLEEARQLVPTEERIFVSWDGSALGDPRVDELMRRFEGVTDIYGIKRDGLREIAGVISPKDVLLAMQRGNVEPQEAARRLHGVILGSGPLRVRLTEAGRQRFRKTRSDLGKAVRKKFHLRLDVLGPTDDLETLTAIPQPQEDGEEGKAPAPAAVLTPEGQLTTRDSLEHDLQLVWNGMRPGTELTQQMVAFLRDFRWREDQIKNEDIPLIEDCFFVLGSPVALAVALSDVGLADKAKAIEAIREAAEQAGIPPETLRLGGSAVAGNLLNQKVAQAAWNPEAPLMQLHRRSVILLSAVVGAVLAFLMVRSLRLAILILTVSVYAAYLAMALVPVTGGALNMVLAVMPTLLLVITLSGAIHVANYWKHAAATQPEKAIAATSRMAAAPCALASITTSIGLLSLCTSSLTPVREFGMYAAAGTLISLLVVLYGLPSLLQLWPGSSPRQEELDHRGWREAGRLLARRPTLQAAAFLAVCAVCSIGLVNFRTETKVIRYFPASSRIVSDYRFLENQLAGIVPVEVLVRFDESAQGQANFLQRMELVRRVGEQLRSHPEITGCLSLADFQPPVEMPGEDAGVLALSRFNKRANMMQQRIRDGEIGGAATFYRQIPEGRPSSDGPSRIAAPGEELWRITAQAFVMSDAEYGAILSDIDRLSREVLRYQPGSHHVVTGAVPLFLQTQQAVLNSLIQSFALAFALVLGIFVIHLRNLWAGLVAMIPNVVPITVVFGILSWCGQRVDIGVMITASIALGIAVDGTLHFLTWFRQGIAEGLTRNAAMIRALEHCGPAMWQTSAAVGIGLLMLMPAELLLISRFGRLMAAMVGVALLADVILLPQLLASPLGEVFLQPPTESRTARGTRNRATESPPPPHVHPVELATNIRVQPH
jgi:predicted RND superfamily exporter protein